MQVVVKTEMKALLKMRVCSVLPNDCLVNKWKLVCFTRVNVLSRKLSYMVML